MYLEHKCDLCGNKFPDDEFKQIPGDGRNLCIGCFVKLTKKQRCGICKREFKETEMTLIDDNKFICEDCFQKRFPEGMSY